MACYTKAGDFDSAVQILMEREDKTYLLSYLSEYRQVLLATPAHAKVMDNALGATARWYYQKEKTQKGRYEHLIIHCVSLRSDSSEAVEFLTRQRLWRPLVNFLRS